MIFRYCISLLFLLIVFFSHAQPGKFFSVDTELSSSLINRVYQDKNDIIWISTEDGLNRFDGSKFTIYKQIDKDENSLLSNLVRLTYEDSKGHLFVGFYNGLQLHDYATGIFTKIPLVLESGEEVNPHVITMLERKNGEVLVGTSGHGLFLLKFDEGKIYGQQNNDYVPSYFINHIYEDKGRNLWIATQDKGLFRLNNNNHQKNFSESKDIPSNNISSIVEDAEGNLYAGSYNQGLFLYDQTTYSFSTIPSADTHDLPINSLYLSSEGIIYIGTEGKGIKTFHPSSKKISDYHINVSSIDFSKVKISSIIRDRSGNIWAGIYQKGVLLLPSSTSNFNYIGHQSAKDDIIGSNIVSAVYKDQEGALWVGTDGDGLYNIAPDGKKVTHYPPGGQSFDVPSTILSIYEDSNDNLWLGSYNKGMARFNKKPGKCEYVNNILTKTGNSVPHIFCFQEDQNKQLWVGSMGSGLSSMDLVTKEVTRYNAVEGTKYLTVSNVLHNDWINSLLITQNQKLYIGTFDGLGCLDLESKSFTSTHGVNRLLPGEIIYTLYEDHQGTLWIGTSKGLKFIEKNTNEVQVYTLEQGLPSNVICAIRGDKNNNLWISTNYGISKMDLKTRNFVNYYADDGLQGNEFSKNSAFIDEGGQIFFGGFNGLTYFQPEEILDTGKKLEIRITDFYIQDKPVKKGMKSGNQEIIDTSVKDADTFYLAHNDNSFTIEFSAMEFINAERITYMYSMTDDYWITLHPGTNNVTFNDLAPGQYQFKVKAKDYNTYSAEKTISVVISPAWYFSAWAKLGYFIIATTIVFLILLQVRHRYRTRQKIMEHVYAKQVNDAKLQFFINIAHEIRTPMTLIISPLKKLIQTDKNREHQRAYFTMHRNSERILRLINQLMDIRKIDKGQMRLKFQETEIVGFLKEICSCFDEQVLSKQIELRFHHETDKVKVWLDPKNFDKIILNVLSNALKHTSDNGKIDIYLSIGRDNDAKDELKEHIKIEISDDGDGIPENELEKVFECFHQTQTAPKNFSEGTGIGLHLTRSIVELHHGTIQVENNKDGKGCRFIIRIPLGSAHLKKDEIERSFPIVQSLSHSIKPLPLPTIGQEHTNIKSKSKYRVLIVDDDVEIRKYICEELANEYHVVESSNGKEALSVVLRESVDLIISDIMMPEMDGITLCRKIKQNVNINHIPLILLTAKSEEEDTLEGLGIGADAYIVKPFNIEILNKTVQNIIKNRSLLRNNFCGNQKQEDKVQKVTMKSADEKLMGKIMDTINKNINNSAFNVEMLANEIGISRVHLHRKTKELTNQSTRDLIRNIRLQQAANLLSTKNLNISEVAYAVGFTNLASFSIAFKEFYGESPTIYMETHLKTAG